MRVVYTRRAEAVCAERKLAREWVAGSVAAITS